MQRFVGVLEKDKGSLWGIWFPDLPGCIAVGETMDDAVAQAPDALRQWAEECEKDGEDLPAARDIVALRRDKEFVAAIEQGSVAILVPLLADTGRTVRVNITLDAGSLAAIDAAAKERGVTRSAFLVSSALDKITGRA